MTAGQPTVGIFSPIGPSTAPSARAASGVSVRPSGGISTGATRCGPGRLARRAYGSGVRYTVIYQATCADICPLFRSERTERLQYLTPMAMRNAIGRAKLHGRPPALPSARSPTPCRVPSPPRRLTRRPSPPQPPAAPWRSPLLRPIGDLVGFVNIHARAILRATVFQIIGHWQSPPLRAAGERSKGNCVSATSRARRPWFRYRDTASTDRPNSNGPSKQGCYWNESGGMVLPPDQHRRAGEVHAEIEAPAEAGRESGGSSGTREDKGATAVAGRCIRRRFVDGYTRPFHENTGIARPAAPATCSI